MAPLLLDAEIPGEGQCSMDCISINVCNGHLPILLLWLYNENSGALYLSHKSLDTSTLCTRIYLSNSPSFCVGDRDSCLCVCVCERERVIILGVSVVLYWTHYRSAGPSLD